MGLDLEIRTHDFLLARQTRYPCVTSPMFFKVLLYQNVFIPARFFGNDLNSQILSNVIAITEGKKISPFGTVIIVIIVEKIHFINDIKLKEKPFKKH